MTTLYLSGFSSFEGVEANPTEDVLRFFSSCDPLVPHACVKESINVLEVSTSAINDYFDRVQVSSDNISIHLGVNSKATTFQLEQFAHNNMTFRVPDVKGFQPNNEPIDDTQDLDNMCCTGFQVHDVCAKLKEEGFKCEVSEDPGRYCCNYIYWKSLQRQEEVGANVKRAIFVHVPPFSVIGKEMQISFVKRVVELLCEG
jgi:pyroglutamyl-peptidase